MTGFCETSSGCSGALLGLARRSVGEPAGRRQEGRPRISGYCLHPSVARPAPLSARRRLVLTFACEAPVGWLAGSMHHHIQMAACRASQPAWEILRECVAAIFIIRRAKRARAKSAKSPPTGQLDKWLLAKRLDLARLRADPASSHIRRPDLDRSPARSYLVSCDF